MTLPISEVQLADMSGIEVKYYIGAAANRPYDKILLTAYAGQYGFGYAGHRNGYRKRQVCGGALSAGRHCRTALRGSGQNPAARLHSTESLDKFNWVHRDRESAWRYIEARIAAYA